MSESRLQKYHSQSQAKSNSPKKKHSGWHWLVGSIVVIIVAIIGVFGYYGLSAPSISQEVLQSGGSSTIFDQNGHQITTLGNENRTYVTIDHVPKTVQSAIVSIEDRHFYQEHLGINPFRIFLAAVNNILSGPDNVQGGSTLTQQLIKLSVFSTKKSDQTIKRKIQEVWLAAKVERTFSKDQILEFYLNKVYLANGTYGFQTAAHYYYGKNLTQLTLPQIALLAGMPQAPVNYDPYRHPQAAKNRRDTVIKAMLNNHKISAAQAQTALNTPVDQGLKAYRPNSGVGENKLIVDSYIKEVIHEVKKKGYDPYRDNLKITVNMDIAAQKRLYQIVNNNELNFPDDKLQTAVTVVNPQNGRVIAMIGGRKVGQVQLGLNRAIQTSRSNGSTMKPLLDYAPAVEYESWATNHPVVDSPYTYPGTKIALENWDHTFQGKMTMRTALAQSRNVPAVRTLSEVGFNKAVDFVNNLGITIPANAGLSAGIGANVSTLQLASAYAALANGGTYYQPEYLAQIETADGITHSYSTSGKRAMSPATAYIITDILKDVVKPGGLGSQAYIAHLYQAGKTGTTNYSDQELAQNPALKGLAKDSLFAGYTQNYAIGVWTGYDSPLQNGLDMTQQKLAGQIYQLLMRSLSASKSNRDWKKPHNVVRVKGTDVLYLRNHQPNNLPAPRSNNKNTWSQNHINEDQDQTSPSSGDNRDEESNSNQDTEDNDNQQSQQNEQNNTTTNNNKNDSQNSGGNTDNNSTPNQPSINNNPANNNNPNASPPAGNHSGPSATVP
ncbi:transglycosylase domain-containing protein [Bombilactobacillus mellifer]|uniref:transglycosylase domain-containing protein n=1 Tax=Bombilactobacillus mellifer TaxID=1218492 RepID=UPI0023EF9507|nr:PBP1A family penicillin-binding protein [Bombilactobacillus mellifer]MCT6825734.1 PBP1A family penicillin-binding protein [Bombilactobacillus mellifer]